jgi:hypothetical protein
MRRVRGLQPSPALIVALAALVVALGGVAYGKAASNSPPHSSEIDACLALPKRMIYVPPRGSHCREHDPRISWGVRGARGAKGQAGGAGADGERGEPGLEGVPGEPIGIEGGVVLHGAGPPNDEQGNEGDFYIDTAASALYGPKTETWAGTGPLSLGGGVGGARGPAGPTGPAGKEGKEGREGKAGPAGPGGATGSAGVSGSRGPEGAKGEAGPPGISGISGYEVVQKSSSQTVVAGETVALFAGLARCGSGKQLLGGGVSDSAGSVLVDGPPIEGSGTANAWEGGVSYHNESGRPVLLEVTASAYCADVAS